MISSIYDNPYALWKTGNRKDYKFKNQYTKKPNLKGMDSI